MPICIECRYPVPTLYTTYSKADDKALGKGVRLTQCPRCKRFADKYVEHDFVVLFIDLVLIKPQVGCYVVMRHNDCRLTARIGRSIDISCSTTGAGKMRNSMYVQQLSLFSWIREQYTEYSKPSITRFGILLLLFDVYLTWARIEKATPSHSPSPPLSPPPPPGPFPSSLSFSDGTTLNNATSALSNSTSSSTNPSNFLATQPILLQYLFFLVLCFLETASFHLPIRMICSLPLPSAFRRVVPYYPRPALISTALLVSSFTKLFPLLLLVWQYDLPSSASAVSWAVIINNVAALEILLDCGYIEAGLLCAIGAVCRAGVGWGILRAVGIAGGQAAAGVVETGDLIGISWSVLERMGFR